MAGLPILVLVGVVAALVAGVAVVRRRRPSPSELLLVREAAEALRAESAVTLQRLDELKRTGALGRAQAAAEAQARQTIAERREALNGQLDRVVDNGLFVSALKASLPRDTWKRDFEAQLSVATDQALAPAGLQRAFGQAVAEHTSGLLAAASPPSSAAACRDAAMALQAIPPARLQRFMQGREELQARLDQLACARQDVAFGAVVTGTGAGILVAGSLLGHDAFVWVAARTLKSVTHVHSRVAEAVLEWLSEEVGEEVVDEALEALGAALTGVGLLFTGWKIAKYAWLIKRLKVDQEHLVTLRQELGNSWRQTLDSMEGEVASSVRSGVRSGFDQLRDELRLVLSEADHQLEWADGWG